MHSVNLFDSKHHSNFPFTSSAPTAYGIFQKNYTICKQGIEFPVSYAIVRSDAEKIDGHAQAVPQGRHRTRSDVVIHPPLHSQFVNDSETTEFNGQDLQLPDPEVAFCLPVAHCEHEAPFCPVNPALHSQDVLYTLPLAEFEFFGQGAHSAFPDEVLKVPVAHGVQSLPLIPACPASHLQGTTDVLKTSKTAWLGHCKQGEEPIMVLYSVASHRMQLSPSAPEYPALQLQVVPESATTELEGQLTQRPGLELFLYMPGLHFVHRPPFNPIYKDWHAHAVLVELAFGDVECIGQLVQTLSSFSNLPAAHAVHSSELCSDVYPALHEHLDADVLPDGEFEFAAGHAKHADFVFPEDVLYVPALHIPHL